MQNDPNIYLLIAGILSALIAVLHFILTVKPSLYRYMNAEELVKIHEKGSPITRLVTLGLMLMFIGWSIYAFSGAGLILELPLLKSCLISISVIYFLRSMLLPMELYKVFLSSYPKRFIFFSMVSLTGGLLYLLGVIELFKM